MHSSTSGSSVLRAINGAVFEIENEMQSQAACRKEEQPKPEEPVYRESTIDSKEPVSVRYFLAPLHVAILKS